MSQNLQNFVKFQKFQLENLVDFEKCYKTHIFLQKSEPIQPKTSKILPKFCRSAVLSPTVRYGDAFLAVVGSRDPTLLTYVAGTCYEFFSSPGQFHKSPFTWTPVFLSDFEWSVLGCIDAGFRDLQIVKSSRDLTPCVSCFPSFPEMFNISSKTHSKIIKTSLNIQRVIRRFGWRTDIRHLRVLPVRFPRKDLVDVFLEVG